MRGKCGKGVGTQVYLVVRVAQLRLVHFSVCKFYLRNCKNNDNEMEGLGNRWYT